MEGTSENLNRSTALQLEEVIHSDADKEQIQILTLVHQNEYRRFVIQLAPDTKLFIIVSREAESRVATWFVSTGVLHNCQTYFNSCHRLALDTDILEGLIRMESPRNDNVMQHLMPSSARLLCNIDEPQPFLRCTQYRLANPYCKFLRRVFRLLDSIYVESNEQLNVEESAVIMECHVLSESEVRFNRIMNADFDSDDNNDEIEQSQTPTQSQSQSQSIDYNETQPSDRSVDFRSSIFLGPDFEPVPQQFWSSSDEDRGEEADDESWESDFDDADSTDTYILRDLRPVPVDRQRLQRTWPCQLHNVVRTNRYNSDGGSCTTNESDDDGRIEFDLEQLTDWQYHEDRSFENEHSRAFRRLIGDLPALTALEERERYIFLAENDPDEPYASDCVHDEAASSTTYPCSHWRSQDDLPNVSDNVQSVSLSDANILHLSENPFRRYTLEYQNNPIDCMPESFPRNFADLRNLLNSKLDNMYANKKHATEPEAIPLVIICTEDPVIPMKSYIQQTDDLIAKLKLHLHL